MKTVGLITLTIAKALVGHEKVAMVEMLGNALEIAAVFGAGIHIGKHVKKRVGEPKTPKVP